MVHNMMHKWEQEKSEWENLICLKNESEWKNCINKDAIY